MSKFGVYSVFDRKAGAFMQPWQTLNDGMAVRAFKGIVADPSSGPGAFPEDYSLFKVSEFDSESGRYTEMEPEPVIAATACVKGA